MSEEEIKEIIKDFLELREIHSSDSTRKSYLSIYQEAIQGLLDLYQQEKEKNKEEAQEEMIPKYKIRAKIEELEKSYNVGISDIYEAEKEFCIEKLKELLEE